jgi:hypothetical protein
MRNLWSKELAIARMVEEELGSPGGRSPMWLIALGA